jgi:integrase
MTGGHNKGMPSWSDADYAAKIKSKCTLTESGCWEFDGFRTKSWGDRARGYGQTSYRGKQWPTHRLAYFLHHGSIDETLDVMHSCDNPPCCNPAHLSQGTRMQNIRECVAKGRRFSQTSLLSPEFLAKPSQLIEGPMTLNDLFDKYEVECIPDLAPRSQRDYASILLKLRTEFGHIEPAALRPRQIVAFLDVKKGRIHRNRMVMILSTIYQKAIGKWCVDDELRNPCTGVERWPTKPRTRYVTDDEFNRMRAICPPQVQIAMDLALLTGQRQSDIVGLTWNQVKAIGLPRDKWHIEIDQGKTGKKLAIMISPAVETVLKRAKIMEPHWPHDYVIRTKWGLRYTPDGFRALWQRCQKLWMKAGNEGFHYHDLRAKSISDNLSLDDAYLLAGHIDMKLTRRVYDRNRRKVQPLR